MERKIILKTLDAINYFGSKALIAKTLGINRQAITGWKDCVPEASAWPLYYIANGKLKAEINLPQETMKRLGNKNDH